MFCFFEHPNLKLAEVDGWGGDERDEILKSLQDCLKQGGVRSGTCASGFGVCCLCELDFTNDNLLAQKINSTNNDQLIFIICYTSVHLYAMNKKTKRRCEKVLNPGSLSFQSEINKVLGLHGGWTLNIEHWTVNSEQWTLNSEQWTANQTRGQNFCPIFWNLLDYKCIWYIERNNPDWPVVWVEPGRKRWFKSWKAPEVFCTNLWSVPWYKVQSRGWCGSIISRWLL